MKVFERVILVMEILNDLAKANDYIILNADLLTFHILKSYLKNLQERVLHIIEVKRFVQ